MVTTEQLVALLGSSPTTIGGGNPNVAYNPATGFVAIPEGVTWTGTNWQYAGPTASGPDLAAFAAGDQFAPNTTGVVTPNGVQAPVVQAPVVQAPGVQAPGAQGGGAPALNVGMGSDFVTSILQLLGQLSGFAIQREQTQMQVQGQREQTQMQTQAQRDIAGVTAQQNAAFQLAGLYAAGPKSAAELAFAQAGQGLPAVGGGAAQLEQLIGASTRGGTGSTTTSPGGQSFSVPNTLSGQQLGGLAGNPNLAGIVESFSRAGGNPDVFRRSLAALLPSGFSGVGSGF